MGLDFIVHPPIELQQWSLCLSQGTEEEPSNVVVPRCCASEGDWALSEGLMERDSVKETISDANDISLFDRKNSMSDGYQTESDDPLFGQ